MYPSFFQIYVDDKMRWVNEEAEIYHPDYKNGHLSSPKTFNSLFYICLKEDKYVCFS